MAMGLFQSIDWLTKKIKSLCCWLGIIEEYTGASLPYVEFTYEKGNASIPSTVNQYNNDIFLKLSQPADFSSFVEYNFGETVVHRVYGSSGNLKLLGYFDATDAVIGLNDPFGLIKEIGDASLKNNILLQYIYLPNVSIIGLSAFMNSSLTTIYIPKCTQLGPTVGDDDVFEGVTGFNITLKINPTLLTCDGGSPDGDIAYLTSLNTVVII